jgi:hypothetical protein
MRKRRRIVKIIIFLIFLLQALWQIFTHRWRAPPTHMMLNYTFFIPFSGSVANFYSPLESPANSDDEEEENEVSASSGIRIPRRNRTRQKPVSNL